LSRRRDIGHASQEDIEQDLWLAVVAQADRFDPTRASLDTYIDRVVNTAAAMILRDRERQKRGNGHRTVSLESRPSEDRTQSTLAAKVSDEDQCRRLGVERRDEGADREQREAVETAFAVMPAEVSDVCRRVMGGSISSAAGEMATSRRQIRNALAQAQSFFVDAGIETE
jgi:hypothetical protein